MKQLKKYIFLLLFLGVIQSFSQTPELNRQKYDNYKENLKYFVIQGEGRGQGLLAAVRNAAGTNGSELQKSGEGGIMQGWYIGMLATEYARLVQNGGSQADKQKAINELSCALNALERLDKVADARYAWYHNGPDDLSTQMDGIAVRTDMWNDVNPDCKPINWGTLNELQTPNCPTFTPYPSCQWSNISQFEKYFKTYYPYGGYNYHHVFFSQDQLYHVLMGLYLTYRYMPNSNLSIINGSCRNSQSINFRNWAKDIAMVFINKLYEEDFRLQDPGGIDLSIDEGGYAVPFCKPLKTLAGKFGEPINDFQWCDAEWEFIELGFPNIDNIHMALVMASISNEDYDVGDIATNIYEDSYEENLMLPSASYDWRAFYPLLHNNLHGVNPLTPTQWCFIENELNSAPINDNPMHTGNYTSPNWAHNLRFLKTKNEVTNGSVQGIFPGIDYMLLYNLYELRWRPTKTIVSNMFGPYSGWDVVVDGVFGSVEVLVTAEINAQNSIKILPNFHVSAGEQFKASIINDICNHPNGGSVWRKADEEEKEKLLDEEKGFTPTVYPNPNTGQFNINLGEDNELAWIQVYDLMGKEVFAAQATEVIQQVDISNQPKGIYLVKVTIGDKVFNEKVVYQ